MIVCGYTECLSAPAAAAGLKNDSDFVVVG